MNAADMSIGQIVFDPAARVPQAYAFFKVVECRDTDLGPWVIEQVRGRKRATVSLVDIERLQEHVDDGGLSGLVGRPVLLSLRFGSQTSGVFEGIEHVTVSVRGEVVLVPRQIVVDGEIYPIEDVEEVVCTN